jgi:type II secretory pathway component PulF
MKFYQVNILYRGKKLQKVIKSNSKQELYNEIFSHYPKSKILKIKEVKNPEEEVSVEDILNKLEDFLQLNQISEETKIFFLSQLAIMLDAGISILDSLKEIENSIEDRQLQKIIISISQEINNGHSMSDAFKQYENIFGNLTITMIKLGDKTGNSAKALFKLVEMLEEIRDNKVKVKKAMSYPRNILIAMIIAMTVIINYVMPKFESIFKRFDTELPVVTRFLLGAEEMFSSYGIYIFLGLMLSIFSFKYALKTYQKFRYYIDFLILKIYVVKDVTLFATLNKFTVVFAELLNSGISIFEALEIAIGMVENQVLREKLQQSYNEINSGSPLHKSFKETGIFDNMVIQMIYTGESSGELQKMLNSIAEYYKRKFDKIIDNMHSLLEPIILLFIGALVTTLALGIFLPIWSLGDAARH